MMDSQKRIALFLQRTPLDQGLRVLQRKLARYVDVADNWNNGDEATNGEAFLIERIAAQLGMVFDIGANLGRWSSMLVSANPNCVIHAFEASPVTFANLRGSVAEGGKWKLHSIGMGEKPGSLAFHDHGENSGLSSFVSRENSVGWKAARIIDVPVTTVDAFCSENGIEQIDFIKVDTEGFEVAVLRGMTQMVARRGVSMIQFEYGGTWLDAHQTLADANEFIGRMGYRLYRLRQRGLERIRYDCRSHECFKYSNFLAVESEELVRKWQIPVVA